MGVASNVSGGRRNAGEEKSLKRHRPGNKKRYLLLVLINHIMSAAEIASTSSEFDILAHKPVQTPVLGTIETAFKSITPVD